MKRRIFLSTCLLAVLLPVGAQSIKQDAAYRTGKLKNGLTYYIRHNAKDPGLADFYIAQRVGSILEEPRQRGLAHFLEHMAFNGTKHFPGKGKKLGVVPWCETIGVKFGANLNAYTSVDQTVYNIASVPLKREGILDSTLLILHDWSHFLLLEDHEIDKERGVIHEEWRTRRSGRATQRMIERLMPVIYQGTKYEDCLPIGSMDIVDHFPYQDLRDYYQKWYRPDLQAIIVVGDVDVDKVEKKIQKLFGKIKAPQHAAERIYYPVPDNDKMIVAIDKDSEQPIMLANLYMKREATSDDQKNTVQYQRDGYVEKLVLSMLNGRFQELQHQSVPPCLSATGKGGQFFVSRTKDAFSLSFGCRQENVKRSFDAAIGVAERARRFGFTQGELLRAKALILANAERQYAERNDRRNSHYVSKALQQFLNSEPMLSADDYLELVKTFDASVQLDEVNAFTREMISDKNQVLMIYAPEKEDFTVPSKEVLEQYVLEAQTADYEPYTDEALADRLINELPKAGSITAEEEAGFGFKKLTLSNGVEVYVKPTDHAKDQISMRFFGQGGVELYPDSDVPNFSFLRSGITGAGVGSFDAIALRKILAGKTVRVNPAFSEDIQAINGTSSVKDFQTMMELTYLYFTAPRKDTVAFNGELNRMYSFLTNREASPQVSYNDSVRVILYGNSPRVQPLKRETLKNVDYDRVLQIYKERFADASGFKMVLVGNVDMDVLRPLLCQYIASLPVAKSPANEKRYPTPDIVPGNFTRKWTKQMNTPSTQVGIYYTFDEPFTMKTDLALDVFKRVLQIAYTDSVREEKGGTYGVSVGYELDKNSKPTSMVEISFHTDPAKYEMLIPIVYEQIRHIAEDGPLPSSMDKVKKFLAKSYEQNITHNEYWDYVMYQYLRYGIDYHTGFQQTLQNLSAADVQQIAKDLLASDRRIEITMQSE